MRSGWLALIATVMTALAGCAGSNGSSDDPVVADGASSVLAPTPIAGVTLPPAGGKFSYQIGGAYTPAVGVTVVDRDRTAAPAAGVYSICYVNAFQAQKEAVADWSAQHPDLLLRGTDGSPIIDKEWAEPLLDISSAAKRQALLSIVGGWLDDCAARGYRGVEADNLDSYTRSGGRLTAANAMAFGALLTTRAHQDHLAMGQKNAADLSAAARAAGFDFAVAEECQVYAECEAYTNVYGRNLIEIEYGDQSETYFRAACAARGRTVSVVRRDRQVTAIGAPAHVEQWC